MKRHRLVTLFVFITFVLSYLPVGWTIEQVNPALAMDEAGIVRFIVSGDTRGSDNGVNTAILGEIAAATIAEGADFILLPGDLTNDGTVSQLTTWRTTMQSVYDASIGVYPVRGNHDASSKANWDSVFTGAYALPGNGPSGEENITFSFTHDNVFVAGLDQYVTNKQVNQTWLDAQFTANTQPHVFVYGHEPAFDVYHSGSLSAHPTERNTFWNSVEAEGGRTYFAGHDHMYNHARIDDGDGDPDNDLHQLVAATGGAPLYSWGGTYGGDTGSWTPTLVHHEEQYGYALVEVDGLDVTITWKHRTAPGVYEAGGDVFTYSVAPTIAWTAYNDLAAFSDTTPDGNFTFITTDTGGVTGLPNSDELVKFADGSATGVTLTVSGGSFNGSTHVDTHTGPALGEAATIFTGISGLDVGANFDAEGTISYEAADSPDGDLVLTFDGLDPGKSYNLVFFDYRDDYGWDRAALATISDVGAFTNESSVATDNPTGTGGTLFDGPSDPSTRLPSDNDNGYVARFTGINVGNDGTMLLTISYDGTGGTNLFKGKYANAVMLEEVDAAPPVPETWTAYVDLNAQSGDSNAANVLEIVPGTPDTQPIDPSVDWVLKDIATGNNLTATMSVDMQVQYPTTNGGDSASGTDSDVIFGGIVDGVGGYEIVTSANDFVTLTFDNLDPGKEYILAVTYNRDGGASYDNRASNFTLDADTYVNASSTGVVVNSEDSVSFSTGNNTANGYVAQWTGVTAADGSFSINAVQDTSQPGWDGSKAYAMTSIMLEQVGAPPPPPENWTAYVDLNAQSGDSNAANVLEIVPGAPDTQPIDPSVDWVLKDIATGNNLTATMSVDMQVQYPTTNGGDSASGTDSDVIFGGIVDGVGGYEIVTSANDFVTLTFDNLDPGKEYILAVTYNRDGGASYDNRASNFTLDADTYVNASSTGVVVNSEDSVSFSTGNNTANGYVAQWTGVTAADGSFSINAVQDTSQPGWDGSKAYAMTSIMLEEYDAPPENWTAYVDLNAQSGDSNAANVLEIVPGAPETQPIDPSVDWVLKDIATGANLLATVSVDMDIRYDTTNGADSDTGTDADLLFGGIVDGVGGYEIDLADTGDYVTLTFDNLDPDKEYVVAVTYNRNKIPPYTDRATMFTLSDADNYVNASSVGVVVNSDDSVSFVTGDNFGNGYVAKWTGVTAADGSFSITAVQDNSTAEGWDTGLKGYAMTSIVLQEMPPGSLPQYTLSMTPSGSGSVTLDPPGGIYSEGTLVQLAAIPEPGWVFSGWSGDLSGKANPEFVNITGNMNITATFVVTPENWTAYNDLAWGSGQLEGNITKITSPNGGSGLPSSGELVDFATGGGTSATLTVTGGKLIGGIQAGHGGEPTSGTDAYDVFNGKLSSLGAVSYQDTAPPPGNLVLTLTGMDPTKLYNLVFYPNRGDYDWDRASLVTISGVEADAFVNESSDGTDNNSDPLFSGVGDDSTRLPAENGTTGTGYVARFTYIDPGSDGEVVLTISWNGTVGFEHKGKYASALMLEEFEAPPAPVADFSGSPTSGEVPLTVDFSDLSTGVITSWEWDFGDGGSSPDQEPSYEYDTPGTYTVSLTVTGPGGSDTKTLDNYITVHEEIIADFSGSPTSGSDPLMVSFSDLSSGDVTSWAWTFGDGGTSSAQNPSHEYTTPGTYTVSLTVTGPAGSDTEEKVDYIEISESGSIVADFSGSPKSGEAPLTVNFTDLSSGDIISWAWSFGDGGSSSTQDPIYEYTTPGTYTVSLTVTGPAGTDTETKVDYITVSEPAVIVADFSGSPQSGDAPLTVNFTDLSYGDITSWAWSFGDGGSSSTQDPSYEYTTPGTYTVSLMVSGPDGSDSETKVNFITVEPSPDELVIYLPFLHNNYIYQLLSEQSHMIWMEESMRSR